MARTTRRRISSGTEMVVVNASAPLARRRSGGGGIRRRSRGGGIRRHRSHSSGGHAIGNRIQRAALGGFGYGMLLKNYPNLPTIPMLGRSGTVAAVIYLLKPSAQWIQDIGIAAAAIAGQSFGQTGVVSGDADVEGVLASQT